MNNRWKPISLSLGGPLVSHLLFANDDLLFCKATEEQARLVAATLDDFCLVSSLKVNLGKSRFVSSSQVGEELATCLEEFLGICKAKFVDKLVNITNKFKLVVKIVVTN